MASYHLRLKKDTKPDGTRVDAIAHAEYVNREGKYKDYDAKRDILEHLSGNFIYSDNKRDVFNSDFIPLYHTDSYGSIASTRNGIELTRKPSLDTMSIALILADRTMKHSPLRLSGSRKFQELAVKAAVTNGLKISFADEKLQTQLEMGRKITNDERRRFIESGGKFLQRRMGGGFRSNNRPGRSAETYVGDYGRIPSIYSNSQSDINYLEGKKGTIVDVAKRGFCLPTLSKQSLVYNGEKQDRNLSLPDNGSTILDNICRRFYQSVRWDVPRARRELAENTAKQIIDSVINKSGEKIAERHLEYINRLSAYEKKGGCLMTGSHLPQWAKGNAKTFFAAADKYEAPTSRRYLELELSLPNELSLSENQKLLEEFLSNHLENHYYAWAIHDKEGVISGQHHPHVHIMFSERIIDDVERKKERGKSYYFRKSRTKDRKGNLYSESVRRAQGAPKDKKWHSVQYLREIRADFARLQNEALKKNGYSITVDHRSLKDQQEQAIAEGDEFLAELLKRVPEEYVGIISPLDGKSTEIQKIIKNRNLVLEQQNILYKAEKLKQEIYELTLKDNVSATLSDANELLHSVTMDDARETIDAISEYEENVTRAIEELNFWKNLLITAEEAEEEAKEEYLTDDEKRIFYAYREKSNQIDNWRKFADQLQEPEKGSPAWINYKEIKDRVIDKIKEYQAELVELKEKRNTIDLRLSEKKLQSNIERAAHNILKSNSDVKKEIEKAQKTLQNQIESLKQIIQPDEKNIEQTEYHLGEIYTILRKKLFGYQKELRKQRLLEKEFRKKVISIDRANYIAKDKYLSGAAKKLRERERKFAKQETYWNNDWIKYEEKLTLLQSEEFQRMPTNEQEQIKNELRETYQKLTNRKKAIDEERVFIETERKRLDEILSTPEAKGRISDIASGIIRKNSNIAKQHQKLTQKCETLQQKIKRTKIRMNAVKERISKEKVNSIYKVDLVLAARIMRVNVEKINLHDSNGNERSMLETIADAMAGDKKALPLVFRSSDDTKLEKNWMLMSDWDRSEQAYKDMLREI